MERPRTRILALASLLVLLLATGNRHAISDAVESLGVGDFGSYWAAFQLFVYGANPYDADALMAAQAEIGLERNENFMVFPAPWVFVVLSPFLALPFRVAVVTWLVFNFALLAVCAAASWKIFDHEARAPSPSVSLLAAALAVPVWKTFETGQLALLLCAALLGAFTMIENRRDVTAGALLAVLTLKPHLFLLLGLAVGVWTVVDRRWGIVLGFTAALGAAAACAAACCPGVFGTWIEFSSAWAASASGPLVWKTGSPATLVREAIHAYYGFAPTWPLAALTGLALALGALWLVLRRGVLCWEIDLPRLLALSLFSAPYLWFSDLTLLLPLQVAVARECVRSESIRWRPIVALGAIQCYAVLAYELLPESGIAVYPLLLLAVWEVARSGRDSKSSALFH